jgi:hypothetical protein
MRHRLRVGEPRVEAAEGGLERALLRVRGAARAVAEVLEVQLVEHRAVVGHGLAAAKLAVVVERVVRRAAVGRPSFSRISFSFFT